MEVNANEITKESNELYSQIEELKIVASECTQAQKIIDNASKQTVAIDEINRRLQATAINLKEVHVIKPNGLTRIH